jgi:hypothetical protein
LEVSQSGAIDQKRRFQENMPTPASGVAAPMNHFPPRPQGACYRRTHQRPHHAPCVRSRMEPNPQRLPLMRDARCAIGAML